MGKTEPCILQSHKDRKHPHARGEDTYIVNVETPELETSPRPWGRLVGRCNFVNGAGNIPTPVGKTLCHGTTGKRTRKHPHARGEDCFSPPCAVLVTETSPRPWGRHLFEVHRAIRHGNIPTPVGKTAIYQLFSNGNNYILWPFQFQIFKDSSKKLLFLLLSGIGRFFLEN